MSIEDRRKMLIRRKKTADRAEDSAALLRRIVSESKTAPPMQLMGVIAKWISDAETIVNYIDGGTP